MVNKAKRFRKVIRQIETVVGPIRQTTETDDEQPVEVLVAVYGRRRRDSSVSVLGGAALAGGVAPSPRFVIADPDTATALRAGAVPVQVGFAWVTGAGTTGTDARAVAGFGHRPGDTPEDLDVWAVELSTPTTAPLPPSTLPPGASPASGWCVIFPFLSMCKTH
ncbi:hypothetical protein [Micropruina sonneratiae]|uniref:hypothetical protein n=1 Tax=Micropruina sonneratiae TaxID=2986940 RepID=UPI0022276D51|nr:hypothetical protein [Micropruina sp. KQZ13P-5]MCW3159550.1 hypothetical protein [Micropruina sp. KQZ13P-5]